MFGGSGSLRISEGQGIQNKKGTNCMLWFITGNMFSNSLYGSAAASHFFHLNATQYCIFSAVGEP